MLLYVKDINYLVLFIFIFFILLVAPGGSILEEGEKATWKTSVCIFESNDDDVKTYVQVLLNILYFFFST